MTKEAFLDQMNLILDLEEDETVSLDDRLETLETWDSVAVISFMALVSKSGLEVSLDAVQQAETVDDLWQMAKG